MAEYTLDELLEMPAYVVDILPERVPASAGERFFAAEDWLLSGARGRKLRQAFADVLIKLNCYFDLLVYREYDEGAERNPAPKKLAAWILKDRGDVNIVLEGQNVLVSVPDMSTYMAVHNANDTVLKLIRQLAASSGLFVWGA